MTNPVKGYRIPGLSQTHQPVNGAPVYVSPPSVSCMSDTQGMPYQRSPRPPNHGWLGWVSGTRGTYWGGISNNSGLWSGLG